MDASTIRIILIVVGALLILLLYLWERHREKQDEYDDYEDDDFTDEEEGGDVSRGTRSRRRAPVLGDHDDESVTSYASSSFQREPSIARRHDEMADEIDDGAYEEDGDALESMSLLDEESEMPALEPLLIQVSVSARRAHFRGSDVMEVSERCGLHPGEMEIFHCLDELDGQTRIYFSMANMVKPGIFPFDAMETFSTPGLLLFAQLKGDPEDLTILDEMIATARKLAQALNGEVLDERRQALTIKKEEAMRQAVLENEMRWAKALMR